MYTEVMRLESNFGFTVKQRDDDRWSVDLPHQCDEWVVTWIRGEGDFLDHESAVREMDSFIAQAQDARDRLINRKTGSSGSEQG